MGRRVLIVQLDGKIPNIALMRIAAHHREKGDFVDFRWSRKVTAFLWEIPDIVYASAIFTKTAPAVRRLLSDFPNAIVGGTGYSVTRRLEEFGITTKDQDYSIYPQWQQSIGFSQRGCRMKCPFCVVPQKEGRVAEENRIIDIWRGDPWPRELLLLDNDFFGQPNWRERIAEIKEGGFKVSFSQGINARFINEQSASAIASIKYRNNHMSRKRIYTAWDNKNDERTLFRGLSTLVEHGVNPDHIMVYMLIGYWDGETENDWEYRRQKLRDFGARPYPMPYHRNKKTVGYQRFVVGAYDKRFSWAKWKAASYRPEKLGDT